MDKLFKKNSKKPLFVFVFIFVSALMIFIINIIGSQRLKYAIDSNNIRNVTAYKMAYNEMKLCSETIFGGLLLLGNIPERLSKVSKADTKEIIKIRASIYKSLIERYRELKSFGVKQVHIHLPNNHSFLRMHKPDRFGDDLTDIRHSVSTTNRTKEKIDTIEEGRIFFGVRFVQPVFYKGEHIGSMGVSFGVEALTASIMARENVLSNLFIKKSVVDKKNFKGVKNNYKDSDISGYYYDIDVLRVLKKVGIHDIKDINPNSKESHIVLKLAQKSTPSTIYVDYLDSFITIIPIINKINGDNIGFIKIISKAHNPLNGLVYIEIIALILIATLTYIFYILIVRRDELSEIVNNKINKLRDLNMNLEEKINHKTKELEAVVQRLNFVIDASNDGLWEWDILTNKVYLSARWKEMLGYKEHELDNTLDEFKSRVHPDDIDKLFEQIDMNLSGRKNTFELEIRLQHRYGYWILVLDRAKTFYDDDGKAIKISGLHTDITERQIKTAEREKMAYMDKLTGIYNRNKFNEIFKFEFKSAKRYKDPLSIAIFDIDHFKDINDNYGHIIGDEVLHTIAQTVDKVVRETDTFARWGGEEFVILFKKTAVKDAKIVVEKIRFLIEENQHPKAGRITVSFGLTELKENDDIDSVFNRCEEAIYLAKKNGRNRTEILI